MTILQAKGEVSRSLTEIRTVHSRAKTAAEWVEKYSDDAHRWEILEDLEEVVRITEKWRRK